MALAARFVLVWLVLVVGPIEWMIDQGFDATIPPAAMTSGGNFAFSAPVAPPPLLETRPDSALQSAVSKLRLFEDGRELGPAHAMGTTVMASGRGAFSHWSDHVYFSTSDGTDPRTNGRRYTVQFPIYPTLAGEMVALFGVPGVIAAALAIFSGVLLLWRRRVHLTVDGGRLRLDGLAAVAAFLAVVAVAVVVTWLWSAGELRPAVFRPVVMLCGLVIALFWLRYQELMSPVTARIATGWTMMLRAVYASLDTPRTLLQLITLILTYSIALILIDSSLLAKQSTADTFKINFEYKVF